MAVSIQAANAQDRAPQIAQSTALVALDIPAGPLPDALANFGRAVRLQVLYPSELARDLRSPGVRGSLPTEQALQQLLSGTGLGYRFTNDTTVTLERQTAGTVNVPAASVEAKRIVPQSEIGNLPPEYAGGQVATGGKLGLLGNRDIMDAPFSMSSYTSKLAQDQQAKTVRDVVANDPSVLPGGSVASGNENLYIRGYDYQGGDFLFNGLPSITPTYNNSMMAESIERIEVFKGPNALLNGAALGGSIGGAVNIVPKRAGNEPLTQFTPDYTSSGMLGGHADIGRRYGSDKELGVRLNGVYRNGDTEIDHHSREFGLAAAGLDYQGERVRLSSDLGFQRANFAGVRRPVSLAAGLSVVPKAPENSTNFHDTWEYNDTDHYYGAVRGEVDITEHISAFASFGGSYSEAFGVRSNRQVTNLEGRLNSGNAIAEAATRKGLAGELGVQGKFETGPVNHQAVAAFSQSERDDNRFSATNTAFVVSNIYNPIYGAEPSGTSTLDLGQVQKSSEIGMAAVTLADTLSILDERVQLMFGARHQEIVSRGYSGTTGALSSAFSDSAISPMVGVVVKPLERLSVYASYIQGLQPGETAPVGRANAGEVFPAYTTKQYEVGTKWDMGRMTTTLSAFQIGRPNGVDDTAANIFRVDGEQQNRGLELSVFGEAWDGIRILSGLTFIDSELSGTVGGTTDGNQATGVPPLNAVIGAEWDTPFLRNFTLTGRATHQSAAYINTANTQKAPDWTRFDVGARYTIQRENGLPIVIRASVENLLDEDYWIVNNTRLDLSTPRTFKLSTSFNF